MRMIHYFTGMMVVAVPLLLVTACLGIFGSPVWHLKIGLVTAIFTVGVHSLMILFMILTGRILREAVKSRDLGREFLDELNVFFAKKTAYPAAIFGAFSIVAAGVLGYGAPELGLSPIAHMLAGLVALVINLGAFPLEYRALRDNKALLDRAAGQLDRIDRETIERGEELPAEEPFDARRLARWALLVAISVWMPYFYWALVVWRGDFSKVSIHPWVEVSILAAFVWHLARRELRADVSAGES